MTFSLLLWMYIRFIAGFTVAEFISVNDKNSNHAQVLNLLSDRHLLGVDFRPKIETDCDQNDTLEYLYYVDSTWTNNNKFGIYIYAESKDFFEIAQNLVNSKGGDWGYVLVPYNVKDYDEEKWGRVFEQLRSKHLIPIIQLWDVDLDDYEDQTKNAAQFLNNYVWPIKERYISVYNEPNSADFWYGKIDAGEYARILFYTIDIFKKENPDYYMLNGGLNISASTDGKNLDAFDFMFQMNQEISGIFNKLDGWASHSYPQPNFSGSPYNTGRNSIKAYETELNYLKSSLGLSKELPVFITETGWAHAEGENYNSTYLSTDTISDYFKIAYEEVWLKDDRVRAVIPFTIKYESPHDHFSWVNLDNVPYKHYDVVKSMNKLSGDPPHVDLKSVKITGCLQDTDN